MTHHHEDSMIKNTSIAQLRKLAEAASPGPWSANEATETLHAVRAPNGRIVADVGYSGSLDRDKDNAAYIAAANPAAILDLIAAIEQHVSATPAPARELTDAARLDFVLDHSAFICVIPGNPEGFQLMEQDEDEDYQVISGEGIAYRSKREAIDAAMENITGTAGGSAT